MYGGVKMLWIACSGSCGVAQQAVVVNVACERLRMKTVKFELCTRKILVSRLPKTRAEE